MNLPICTCDDAAKSHEPCPVDHVAATAAALNKTADALNQETIAGQQREIIELRGKVSRQVAQLIYVLEKYDIAVSTTGDGDHAGDILCHDLRSILNGKGRCPWCMQLMKVGDECPVIERICEDCAKLGYDVLKKNNPTFNRAFEAASRLLR